MYLEVVVGWEEGDGGGEGGVGGDGVWDLVLDESFWWLAVVGMRWRWLEW